MEYLRGDQEGFLDKCSHVEYKRLKKVLKVCRNCRALKEDCSNNEDDDEEHNQDQSQDFHYQPCPCMSFSNSPTQVCIYIFMVCVMGWKLNYVMGYIIKIENFLYSKGEKYQCTTLELIYFIIFIICLWVGYIVIDSDSAFYRPYACTCFLYYYCIR